MYWQLFVNTYWIGYNAGFWHGLAVGLVAALTLYAGRLLFKWWKGY